MVIVDSLKDFFIRAIDFQGRSTRSQYWFVALAWFVFQMVLNIVLPSKTNVVTGFSEPNMLIGLINLVLFVPFLALAVRRLRDAGYSPWLMFVALVPIVGAILLIVWFCMPSKDAAPQQFAGAVPGYAPQGYGQAPQGYNVQQAYTQPGHGHQGYAPGLGQAPPAPPAPFQQAPQGYGQVPPPSAPPVPAAPFTFEEPRAAMPPEYMPPPSAPFEGTEVPSTPLSYEEQLDNLDWNTHDEDAADDNKDKS